MPFHHHRHQRNLELLPDYSNTINGKKSGDINAAGVLEDLDMSDCSTLTVEHLPIKEISTMLPSVSSTDESNDYSFPQEQQLRHVRFDESRNQKYSAPPATANAHLDDLWYSRENYEEFKLVALNDVNSIWDIEYIFQSSPASYLNVLEDFYEACLCCYSSKDETGSTIPWELQLALEQLMSQQETSLYRIGLEKHSAAAMKSHVAKRRQDLWRTVNRMQELFIWCGDDYSEGGDDELVHNLAEACSNLSRPQRMFSTFLAKAHAQCNFD
eukprot:CAMPEP_0198141426 /NCGR_PEP_ID=MMETSP1443-20131203/4437_1 /TAXON_ID=186043 /ORGANISM="Entomoneis sp., Strain CCMP2396" /LENGTH=269 /DNA_ID=CAMNT_0043804173 /DNA_START=61 /DNA_END=870 /DNA_ORIENTATION=+